MVQSNGGSTGADTRLLRAVHRTFRLNTDRFVEATARLAPSELQRIIGPRWTFYSTVLHHHHHSEDDSAFPALLAVRPEMRALVESLEQDHRRLDPLMDGVDRAIATLEDTPSVEARTALNDALVAVRDAFFPHLDVEDAQIIPAFAESIPPAEWKRMDDEALKTIPRTWLSKAVGALDEVIRSLPEADRPAPPPMPIRTMLALSWRKKWSAWIEPMLV